MALEAVYSSALLPMLCSPALQKGSRGLLGCAEGRKKAYVSSHLRPVPLYSISFLVLEGLASEGFT